jgi:hypothetical protein
MPVPDFSPGEVLTAAAMDSIGLWLVKTQTVGAGVASVSVPNAFNNDFVNYRVVYDQVVCTVSDTTLGIRPGGVATTTYESGGYFVLYNGSGVGYLNAASSSFGIAIGITSTVNTSGAFDIYNPNIAARTRAMGMWSGDAYAGQYGGVHTVATAYTSFDFAVFAGTMTGGTIRVYGYRN